MKMSSCNCPFKNVRFYCDLGKIQRRSRSPCLNSPQVMPRIMNLTVCHTSVSVQYTLAVFQVQNVYQIVNNYYQVQRQKVVTNILKNSTCYFLSRHQLYLVSMYICTMPTFKSELGSCCMLRKRTMLIRPPTGHGRAKN